MTPRAHSLRACLPELADRTSAQLLSLYDDPAADRCDWMLTALQEVYRTVCGLQAELVTGEPPTV